MIYTLASKQSLFRYPLAFNLVGFGRTAQLYIIASWFRGSGRQGAGLRVSELRVSFTGFGLYKDLAFRAQEYRDPHNMATVSAVVEVYAENRDRKGGS